MQIALPHPGVQTRQLAPFVVVSLVLHMMLLFDIRLPTKNFSVTEQHPLEVYFSAPPISDKLHVPSKARITKSDHPPTLLASPPRPQKTPAVPLVAQPDATLPADTRQVFADTPKIFNLQQPMESAKSLARDEAKKIEQQIAALKMEKLDSPLGLLEQSMKQPHKEIHLANGILKIVTSTGSFCIQPTPYFARDSAGVFGIPTTCP